MAELSKQALKVQNNTEFPNNNAGLITPSKLRGFNVDMIDSLVDEISYMQDSASWNGQIDSLENFTASINAYTASNNQKWTNLQSFTASITASVQELLNLSSSLSGGYVTQGELADATGSLINQINTKLDSASFNSYTQSTDNRLTNIELTTASINVSIANLNAYTASDDNSITQLEAFTQSANLRLTNLEAATASINSSITQLNASSASQQVSIDALNVFTASQSTASIVTSITNLNSATGSLFNSASLGLTTASVNLNTLTFRKGDGTTFNLTVDTGSGGGGSINTGSLLVTSSFSGDKMTFTKGDGSTYQLAGIVNSGSSTIIGTMTFSADSIAQARWNLSGSEWIGIQKQVGLNRLIWVDNNNEKLLSLDLDTDTFSVSGAFNAGLQQGYAWVGDSTNRSQPVPTSSFAGGSTNTGSLLVTASAAGADITFTKGDGSTFTITTATGSVASASFAETASLAINAKDIVVDVKNTTGAQINKGTVVRIIGATGDNPLIGTASWTDDDNSANTLGFVTADIPNDSFGRVMTQGTLLAVNTDPTLGYTAGQLVYLSSSGQYTNVKPPVPYHEVRLGQVLRAQQNNGSIYVLIQNGYELTELHDVDINTGSLANNDLLAYDSASTQWTNKTLNQLGALTTSSFVRPSIESISGSVLITANTFTSGASSITHISASAQNQANLLFKTNNNAGSTIVSGSLNIYANGSAPAAGRLNYLENSNIFLNESGFLPTVTASVLIAGGFYPRMRNNMWLGTGPWTINTNAVASSSVQAGSYNNNLFLGSTGTTINTLGNTSGPAFSHNILAQAGVTINAPSRSLAQIAAGASGSNSVNFANNAAFGGTITYNGPVSSSAHTISGNSVQGTVTFNLQSGSRACTISNNNINGTFTINDNTVFAPTLGSTNFYQNNIINGTATINNRFSSSFTIANNNINTYTISNDADLSGISTAGQRNIQIGGSALFGALNNNIYFSGSAGGTTLKAFVSNLMAGNNISASIIFSGGGEQSLLATTVLGNGLNVFGTSLINAANPAALGGKDAGSAFIGRYNATDGNRANTAETIFAVGTGTSGSAGIVRKTGFLIDSGSNTFVEGSLNVSGSASFTGSVAGNVVSASITSNTASIDFNLGNYFEVTASVTPLHLNVTNIKPGTTSTLIISASASSSILFSPNVKQPSPGAYSGSAVASTDILSLVSFNGSTVNLVATKNLI